MIEFGCSSFNKHIWKPKEKEDGSKKECMVEIPSKPDEGEMFIDMVVDIVLTSLKIGSNRDMMFNLLKSCVYDKMVKLLEEYENYQFEEAAEKLCKEFELEQIPIKHQYASHAKLSTIIEKIKEKYK